MISISSLIEMEFSMRQTIRLRWMTRFMIEGERNSLLLLNSDRLLFGSRIAMFPDLDSLHEFQGNVQKLFFCPVPEPLSGILGQVQEPLGDISCNVLMNV
ncbi:hypothetical protein TNCT_622431 [Trichonephila clavata]|uniref:Uncharacterized protein n=1 Tax=Trichonephila clavata TaxID=2740835 RepID=A0A8X6KH12_TRICU|nr:hypothetical protein TNCT_622431 [Trichonephila clavata]